MDTYRAILKPRGAHIFNWGSDALFGSFCWALHDTVGEKSLYDFIDSCRNSDPPIVFSNGFPGDWFPRPCSVLSPRQENASRDELINSSKLRKKIKSINYLTTEEFKQLLDGNPTKFDGSEFERKAEPMLQTAYHNTIDRCTGTSLQEGGGLYTVDEFFENDTVSVYMRIQPDWVDKVSELLRIVGIRGVGAKKSSGRGGFDVVDFSRYDEWPTISDADGFVSLSNYVPAPDDPLDGIYRFTVKFGRLDREFAAGAPFKRPLIQLLPGAVFRLPPSESVRPFYGCLVEKIAPSFPNAVQGCYTLAVPCRTTAVYPCIITK